MTLLQLRYLIAVIDSGLNISRAAQRANSTQPGISKQLKLLEDELGFQIFLRKGKALERLSNPGRQVVERARVMLAEAAQIRTMAMEPGGEPRGRVRIACTPTQAGVALMAGLSDLKIKHPDVDAQIRTVGDLEAMALLDRGEADVAFVNSSGRPQGTHLAFPLYRWSLIAVAPVGHVIGKTRKDVTLADVAAFPLVTDQSVWDADVALTYAFARVGCRPRVACTVNDPASLKSYVRDGLGIGLLAEMHADRDMDGLSVLSVEGLPDAYTTWALVRTSCGTPNYLCDFLCALAPHIDSRDIRRSFDLGRDAESWTPLQCCAPDEMGRPVGVSRKPIATPRSPNGANLQKSVELQSAELMRM